MRRLLRPFQVTILDPHGGRKARTHRIRPLTVLLLLLLPPLVAVALTLRIIPHSPSMAAGYYRLQHVKRDLERKLAEQQAELSLRKAQLQSLRKELAAAQAREESLHQRLQTYTSILEARKSTGVHILSARASWNHGRIEYAITMVKGGNFPRRVKGKLRLTALDDRGHNRILHEPGKTAELPYEMETHTFLHGTCTWDQDWRPTRLLLQRLDRQGRTRDRMEIRIQGENP